jgi:hypothetical protein
MSKMSLQHASIVETVEYEYEAIKLQIYGLSQISVRAKKVGASPNNLILRIHLRM